MGERMDKRIRFYIYWILGFVLLGACAPGDKEDVYTEMRAFEDFSHINGDSVAIVPRKGEAYGIGQCAPLSGGDSGPWFRFRLRRWSGSL